MSFGKLQEMANAVARGVPLSAASVAPSPSMPAAPISAPVPAQAPVALATQEVAAGAAAPKKGAKGFLKNNINTIITWLSVAALCLGVVYVIFRLKKQEKQIFELKQECQGGIQDHDVNALIRKFFQEERNQAFIRENVSPLMPWEEVLDEYGRHIETSLHQRFQQAQDQAAQAQVAQVQAAQTSSQEQCRVEELPDPANNDAEEQLQNDQPDEDEAEPKHGKPKRKKRN